MQFELTKEFLSEISDACLKGNTSFIAENIEELHPADIADILDEVNLEEAKFIYRILNPDKAADVLTELDDDTRERFLAALSTKEIAEQLDNMDSDDAVDVIQDLPEERQEKVIAQLEDEEQASDIVDLLSYDEDTAGGLMAKEFISVQESWTVGNSIPNMRKQSADVSHAYTIYVVDKTKKLLGTLSLKSFIFAEDETKISDIYMDDVKSVNVNVPDTEVVSIMDQYGLVVIPVVNDEGTLVGRITIDDVVDVMREEAEKDYAMASGISEKVESSDSVWTLSRARLPWLLVGLAGGLLGAQVITMFEETLQIYAVMASFIPVVLAMGGNVGVQSAAIVVQAIASNSFGTESTGKKLLKEFGVAILNGVICSALLFAYAAIAEQDWNLAITVSVALISVFIYAGIFGAFVPIFLNRLKIDPALATGPFITTMNDVFGLLLYFIIGDVLYF